MTLRPEPQPLASDVQAGDEDSAEGGASVSKDSALRVCTFKGIPRIRRMPPSVEAASRAMASDPS